jgi:hypothetical protein
MVDPARARELALSFPGASERDHHGRPSYRTATGIFATLWTARAMNVMAGDELIRAAVATHPDVCSEVRWGARLAAVRVDLDAADEELLRDLIAAAWERRAPPGQR